MTSPLRKWCVVFDDLAAIPQRMRLLKNVLKQPAYETHEGRNLDGIRTVRAYLVSAELLLQQAEKILRDQVMDASGVPTKDAFDDALREARRESTG